MQQLMIYWKSVVPQHVSGVFTPIVRRSDCVFTAYRFLSCCNCCDVGESAGKLCALCGVGCLQPTPHSAHSLPADSPTSQQLQQDRKR